LHLPITCKFIKLLYDKYSLNYELWKQAAVPTKHAHRDTGQDY